MRIAPFQSALSQAVVAIALTAAVAAAPGCGKHPGSYESLSAEGNGDVEALIVEAEALWAERHDAAKLEQALVKYEEAVRIDPEHRDALIHLTRGWYLLGDAHASEKETKLAHWDKALEWGAICLASNSAFAEAIVAGEKEKDAVVHSTKADVPCLYWTSSALGKWGKIQGLAKTLKFLPTVKAYMEKADELDPTYFHYGPARYWGAYYSVLPSFAGQDLEKSAEYFAESIANAPDYMPTRFLRAELLAVKTQDPALFEEDLKFIMAFDVNTDADVLPENSIELARAPELLSRMNELFDKKTLETYQSAE
jgi:tetratricopeptide (TPR) repeat protein